MGVEFPDETVQQPQTESIIYCTGQKEAMQICVNEHCKNNRPFTCGTRKCICQQQHRLCSKASIDYVIEFIKAKVASSLLIGQSITSVFSLIIDKLSQISQSIQKQVQSSLKYSQLSQTELTLLKIIEQNQSADTLSGEMLSKMWKSINQKSKQSAQIKQYPKNQSSMSHLQQKVSLLQNSINQSLQVFTTSSRNSLFLNHLSAQKININQQEKPKLRKSSQSKHLEYQTIFLPESSPFKKLIANFNESQPWPLQLITEKMLSQSSVVTKTSEVSNLISFFQPKNPSKIKLLFKASQHKFSIQKYNQICGHETDTMILCRTKKNRILGGFTPLSFKTKSWFPSMQADLSHETFLFTVTHNEKFPIRDFQNAVLGGAYTIKFGMDEFVIVDKADSVVECKFGVWSSFKCVNYKPEDPESNLLLNGNSTCYFSVKEWEVWKVQFDEK